MWILLACCLLIIFSVIGRWAAAPMPVVGAGALAYLLALIVIILGLHQWRGRALARPALILSVLWAAWSLVGIGLKLFMSPARLTWRATLISVAFFSVIPGILSVLALLRLGRAGKGTES